MKQLTIGAVPEHFSSPVLYAVQQDLFSPLNLQVHFKQYPEGTGAMCQDLQNKHCDVAILLTEGACRFIAETKAAKIIAPFVNTPLTWGIFVAKNSAITHVNDLANKRFAISRYGSGSHLMTYLVAKKQNWDLSSLQFQVKGGIDHLCQALTQHEADAFLWEVFTTKPKVDAGLVRMIDTIKTPWPCFCIAARHEVLEQMDTDIYAMLQLMQTKWQQFLKNKEQAIDFIAENYSLQARDVKQWLQTVDWANDLNVDSKMLAAVEDVLRSMQIMTMLSS